MELFLTRAVEALLLPPGLLLLPAVAALGLLRARPALARALLALAVAGLYLFSLPPIARGLIATLEAVHPPASPAALAGGGAQAIVVLGGGRYARAPEYGYGDTAGAATLERLRYAAYLQRATRLPLLASGGNPYRAGEPDAGVMRQVLQESFGVPVRWVETASRTTWENARESAALLAQEGVGRVALVTHAWHMPRAVWSFTRHGLQVLPAPTAFTTAQDPGGLQELLPEAAALYASHTACREWLGRLWYALRHG